MDTKKMQWTSGVAVLALAGCAGLGGPAGAPGTSATPATCDAAAAQFAIGQSFGPALERDVRARSGASIVRWLSPGQAVTMEFNPARLNLTLDGRSRITKVACG
ncbi:I78 family peptidase inhibitor [Pseudorhodoferax sp. Leaf274]|uniref:I78 family peptidase inhibitor n=1 Tax=Pseudorhodoferax sp. Leaf274 TaxID=1736318 RepID=UPI0009E99E37|nr:I78 family peptidase inhibitor [Pseudorhodoferax sp. Leaf274]